MERAPREAVERDYRLLITGADGTLGINGALLSAVATPGPRVRRSPLFVCTVAVEDLAETERRITAGGGERVVDRREVEGVGRLAYFRDPEGNILLHRAAALSAHRAPFHRGRRG